MAAKALYPGTFDPITNGHTDLVARAATVFDEIIVAVGKSSIKNPIFSLEERIELTKDALASVPNVRVCGFDGILADFAEHQGIRILLRGVRSMSDFEDEFQRANINRMLKPDLETVLMTPGEGFTHISSSLVREVFFAGGDVGRFVHPAVKAALDDKASMNNQ